MSLRHSDSNVGLLMHNPIKRDNNLIL